MKVGDTVKLSEEYYPEYKDSFGILTEKKTASGPGLAPMWQVMIQTPHWFIHPFYVPSEDVEVVGFDEDKMIGGKL